MIAEATRDELARDAPAPEGPTTASDPEPLRAVHTSDFPALLRQLGASHLVTTYQAGKLVMVRDEGDRLAAQPADDQGAVQLAEVLPGSRVAGLGTNQQARSGHFHRRPPRLGRPPVRPAGTPRPSHYRPIP